LYSLRPIICPIVISRRSRPTLQQQRVYYYYYYYVYVFYPLWWTPKPPSIMWFSARRTHAVAVHTFFLFLHTRTRGYMKRIIEKNQVTQFLIYICNIYLQWNRNISLFVQRSIDVYWTIVVVSSYPNAIPPPRQGFDFILKDLLHKSYVYIHSSRYTRNINIL